MLNARTKMLDDDFALIAGRRFPIVTTALAAFAAANIASVVAMLLSL